MTKGLEALEIISSNLEELYTKNIIVYPFKVEKCNIEKELKDKEKKDKALEIITRELNVEIEEDKGAYFICITGWYFEIPKEEYNLLKEVLYGLPTK